MLKYIKNYLNWKGYTIDDWIPCEVCWLWSQHIHHIQYKSHWWSDDFNNLVALCYDHHDKAHFKKKPYLYKEELQEIHDKKLGKESWFYNQNS